MAAGADIEIVSEIIRGYLSKKGDVDES